MNSTDFIDHVTIDGTTKYFKEHRPQWELIREGTFTNATEADYTITQDGSGNTLDLTDLIIMFETPMQNTYSSKGAYGQIALYYTDNDSVVAECGAWTQEANTSAHSISAWVKSEDGMVFIIGGASTTSSNNYALRIRYSEDFIGSTGFKYYPGFSVKKIIITKVTGTGHYKLYGKRK